MSEENPPIHQKLDGAREYEAGLNTLLEQAQHTVRIFDFSLSDGGYNSPRRFVLVQRFLLASPANRLKIVLHETDYLLRFCPRMMMLIKQFSHAIEVNQTNPEARRTYDPFAITDRDCHVHRFHYEDSRAVLVLHDLAATEILNRRFDEIWDLSSPIAATTVLGL